LIISVASLPVANRLHHIKSTSTSSSTTTTTFFTTSSSSLTGSSTPTAGHSTPHAVSGSVTPIAGPSNQSMLPASSPTFWDDLDRSFSDMELDKSFDSSQTSDVEQPQELSPILSLLSPQERCQGSLIQWQPGSVWMSYPYQQHGVQTLPWEPIGFKGNNQLWLHSVKCKSILKSKKELDEHVCSYCRGIETSAAFVRFVDWAIIPAKHTPWQYLSNRHLLQSLAKATAEVKMLKLKVHA
jgi:hypothetical protein